MDKICRYCGKGFKTHREWQKFCSSEHRKLYWHEVYAGRGAINKRLEKLEKKVGLK